MLPEAPRPPAGTGVLDTCWGFPACGKVGFTAAGLTCGTLGCCWGSANGLSLEDVRGGGKPEADLEDSQCLAVGSSEESHNSCSFYTYPLGSTYVRTPVPRAIKSVDSDCHSSGIQEDEFTHRRFPESSGNAFLPRDPSATLGQTCSWCICTSNSVTQSEHSGSFLWASRVPGSGI